jgi:hypothetical protein
MVERPPNQRNQRGRWHPPPSSDKAEKEVDRLTTLAEMTRMRLGQQQQQQQLRTDPPDRKDGRCVQCRGERPEIAVKNGDPFCSTACARDWHDRALGSP